MTHLSIDIPIAHRYIYTLCIAHLLLHIALRYPSLPIEYTYKQRP